MRRWPRARRLDLSASHLAASFAGSAEAGALHVFGGGQSGELYHAGQFAGGAFQASADGHGGELLYLSWKVALQRKRSLKDL